MSEPRDEQARQQRYDELLQQIGASLIGAAPQGWRRIDLIAKIAEGVQDFGLTVIMSDLSYAEVEPPAGAGRALVELRELTKDVRGPWLSARYVIEPPGAFQIFYNFEHDPLWDPPIAAGAPRRELETEPIRPMPLRVEELRDLQRTIADLLVVRAPADRDQIRVAYRATGSHEETVGHILGLDGRLREWEAPPELPGFFRRLRAGMYKDGVGTWSAASVVVEYPIRSSINYLHAEDPRWRTPPPRTAVLEELERFPRTPEHVPQWMKAVLSDAERVAAPKPQAPTTLSDRERTVLALIERRVSEAGAVGQAYRILDAAEGATCLERVGDQWQVADYERGRPRNPQRFDQLWDAGAYLLGTLTITPSSLRAGGGDRNTATALGDWPIQPLPSEPPLTLLREKHIAALMPDREIVRYGPPSGNLVFSAGTAFNAMSLRAEREGHEPHHYRVVRELRALAGRTVPWHDQPGGGAAYFLPKSIEDHLADGSLTEIVDAQVESDHSGRPA